MVVIVDDHLGLLAIARRLPQLPAPGPVVTTYSFWCRMARAVAHSGRSGALSRRFDDPGAATDRVLRPPADRLLVLDPRVSGAHAVGVASRHRANLLLAELIGGAVLHAAPVWITRGNLGARWEDVFRAEAIELGVIDV